MGAGGAHPVEKSEQGGGSECEGATVHAHATATVGPCDHPRVKVLRGVLLVLLLDHQVIGLPNFLCLLKPITLRVHLCVCVCVCVFKY